jgi:hypothetical protein
MDNNLVPPLGTHVLILGENEMGKTTLAGGALNAASETYPVFVVDSKGEEIFDVWPTVDDETEILPRLLAGRKRTVYRPTGEQLEADALDKILLDVYMSGWSGVIYVDELEHVAPNAVPKPGCRYILLSGRRRKVNGRIVKLSFWGSSHRSVFIPRNFKNEPKRYFVFAMSEDDLKDISPYMGGAKLTRPDPYWFWYYDKKTHLPAKLMPPLHVRNA